MARKRRSAIDGRTTRHEGYRVSQRVRKLIEGASAGSRRWEGAGSCVTAGLARNRLWAESTVAEYNLVRLAKLVPAASRSQGQVSSGILARNPRKDSCQAAGAYVNRQLPHPTTSSPRKNGYSPAWLLLFNALLGTTQATETSIPHPGQPPRTLNFGLPRPGWATLFGGVEGPACP